MSSNPSVSIIIPVYNVSEYLEFCLDSVLFQQFRDIEVVCVDDVSPDNSLDILKKYAASDSRIVIVERSENGGLAAARNSGIKASRGKYLYFLDSDDAFYGSDSIERLFRKAEECNSDVVIGGIYKWFPDVDELYLANHACYLKAELTNESVHTKPVLFESVIACNKLLRRSFLEENDILYFEDKLRRFEDNPFTWKIHILSDKTSVIPEVTYLFRQPIDNNDYFFSKVFTQAEFLVAAIAVMKDFFDARPELGSTRHLVEKKYFNILTIAATRWPPPKGLFEKPDEFATRLLKSFSKVAALLPQRSYDALPPKVKDGIKLAQGGAYSNAWETLGSMKQFASKNTEVPKRLPSFEARFKQKSAKESNTMSQGENLAGRLHVLRENNKRLARELDALYASQSWRIMKLFRVILKAIRGY